MTLGTTVFHTATVDYELPGLRVAVSAYNLQYTRPLVSDLVEQNPPASADAQVLAVRERKLVRVNLYGHHPSKPSRRLCVIGVGHDRDRAEKAANDTWFDFHASVLFTGPLDEEALQRVAIGHKVPGCLHSARRRWGRITSSSTSDRWWTPRSHATYPARPSNDAFRVVELASDLLLALR